MSSESCDILTAVTRSPLSWARKASQEQPNWATPWRVAAVAHALSDRAVEAQEAMARMREIDPALRLSRAKSDHVGSYPAAAK